MATQLSRKRVAHSPTIPDRLYFKIGDVARICELETYVLRFWETQFPKLKPNKSGTGQRLYKRRDVEMVLEIKRLVHGEGYTLPGARHALGVVHRHNAQREPQPGPTQTSPTQTSLAQAEIAGAKRMDAVAAAIGHARAELREIAALLASPVTDIPRRRGRLATIAASSGSLFPS
jgi:DNA-binding transcriptional MerR regulator